MTATDLVEEAVKLGAFIEFDFRNTLEGGRMHAIRKVGPQFCFLSEFWTKAGPPREYGGPDGMGAFAEAMRSQHGAWAQRERLAWFVAAFTVAIVSVAVTYVARSPSRDVPSLVLAALSLAQPLVKRSRIVR